MVNFTSVVKMSSSDIVQLDFSVGSQHLSSV